MESSTSTTSTGGRGGGGRGDVVEEGAEYKQRLSPATIVDEEPQRNKMEKERLHQDLALSNDLVVSDDKQSYHH